MLLLKFQNQIPPPIVVVLLLLLSPLTACGGPYGDHSTGYKPAGPTLTVTVTDNRNSRKPVVAARVFAQLTYKYDCNSFGYLCKEYPESRASLQTNSQGQVAIPLPSQEKSGLHMPTEVKVWCVKAGYKAGAKTIYSPNKRVVANCSMQPDNNYQGLNKIKVIDKSTGQQVLKYQLTMKQSVDLAKAQIWEFEKQPTEITVSADKYHPKTVTIQPSEWPATIELDKLVYQYSLRVKLSDQDGNEIKGNLPDNAKVSIEFNGEDITPQYSSWFPLTVPTQKSKTQSKEEQFTVRINYPPYKETVVTLGLASSLWDYDRYSRGVLKATYSLSLEKQKKGLVVLVNQANAWKGKPYGTWKKSLRVVFNSWWETQQKFSYFGYGRIAAGVYPRLIHQSDRKAPASLIMGERMFNAFVEPHKLADFFLEGTDDAIWSKLLDADDQPKADEWFFIMLLPHNTSLPFYATVERYESYAGKKTWQTKLAQLQANLEKYNAHLYIIEDFFKPAEEDECQVADSTTTDEKSDDDDDVTESTNQGESSINVAESAVEGSEPPTEDNCAPQSTERSIIKALSNLERVSYQAIPYETFNDSVPKTVLNGLLEQIETDVE